MKKLLFLSIIATFYSTSFCFAEISAGTNQNKASANILKKLVATSTEDLDFGTIISSAHNAGSVTVEPGGNVSDQTNTSVSGGHCGEIKISGPIGENVVVTISSTGSISKTNDSETSMSLSDLKLTGPNVQTPSNSITIPLSDENSDEPGTATVYSGGKLSVSANQSAGIYSGNVDVSVSY